MMDTEKKLRSQIELLVESHKRALHAVDDSRARVESEREDRTLPLPIANGSEAIDRPTWQFRVDSAQAALRLAERRAAQLASEVSAAGELLARAEANEMRLRSSRRHAGRR